MISKEDKMINILQSFVNIAEPQLYKYENLKEDVEATKWAINKINELEKERDYYKQRYLEFNNAFIEGGKKLNTEAMLRDLKRSKLYERSTEDIENTRNFQRNEKSKRVS